MKKIIFLLIAPLLFTTGCTGDSSVESASTADRSPITVEQWKLLPNDQKFDPATYDRLKAKDPSLKKEDNWEELMNEVIAPALKENVRAANN